MSARTPGPWIRCGAHIDAQAGTHNVRRIAKVLPGNGALGLHLDKLPGHEVIANADFIVRACNAHDALVIALKGLVAARGGDEPSLEMRYAMAVLAQLGEFALHQDALAAAERAA